MERILSLNLYQPKQALYRGYDIIEGKSKETYRINSIYLLEKRALYENDFEGNRFYILSVYIHRKAMCH